MNQKEENDTRSMAANIKGGWVDDTPRKMNASKGWSKRCERRGVVEVDVCGSRGRRVTTLFVLGGGSYRT